MKTFLKTKPIGFYLNLTAGLLSVVAAILYICFYRNSNEYLLESFLFPLIAGCLVCTLSWFPLLSKCIAYLGVVGFAASIASFFYATYYYISVVFTGIDAQGFDPEYLTIAILLIASFFLSSIALFFQNPAKSLAPTGVKVVRISLKAFYIPFALLAFVGLYGESAAFANEGAINAQFGISPYHLERGNVSLNSDYFESDYEDIASLRKDGEALVAEVEEEGAVLLKNENAALPLAIDSSVTLFSLSSVDPAYGGEGSSAANNPKAPLDFQTAFEEASIHVNPTMYGWYQSHKKAYAPSGYAIKDAPWDDFSAELSPSFASYSDAAIVVLKRVRGENTDVPFQEPTCDGENGNYLALNANEKSVFAGISALKGSVFRKLIVLLNTPNPLELSFLNDYPIDALLWVGTLGQTGLAGVARLLSGEANPSGKLSDTFYYHHSDNPVMANWGPSTYGNYEDYLDQLPSIGGKSYSSMQYASYVAYQEGIYVGYRYSETRYEDVVSSRTLAGDFDYSSIVAFPFGYGLSYTNFSYGNFTHRYEASSDEHHLSVEVTNTGSKAGKEAVQLYLQKPYTEYDEEHGIEKSAIDLVDYAKTRLLNPGEKETLSFVVPAREFASYDADGVGTYLVEESDDYRFAIGSSSHDAINNILADKGYSEADGMDETGNPSLVERIGKVRDETAYSRSETGAKIHNLFDSMDVNRYEGKGENSMTYLSRADWIDTLPSRPLSLSLNDDMMSDLLAQDKGEVASDDIAYPTYEADNDLSLADLMQDEDGNPIPLDNDLWDLLLDELSYEDTARLLTTGLRKTAGLESIAKPMTVDHNGPTGLVLPYAQSDGLAQRLDDPDGSYSPPYYPCLGILASSFNKELAERVGEMLGEDALWAGYSGFYGVGVNTHRSAYDGRAFEYYSEDGFLAGKQAARLTIGLQRKGCNAYAKHIAGYEQQNNRVGLSIWCNEQAFREIYLKPFQMAFLEGKAMNAMTAYSRLGLTLCPASKDLLEGFVREECGMKGIVVSDMWTGRYTNGQLPACVQAGLSLTDSDLDSLSLFAAYREGHGAYAWKMREAAKHILYSVVHSNAMNGITSDTIIRYVAPEWKGALSAGKISALTIFVLLAAGVFVSETVFRIKKIEP